MPPPRGVAPGVDVLPSAAREPDVPPIRQLALLDTFRCLGPECVATCCAGWRIVVDAPTRERWAATGDEDALAAVVEDDAGACLRHDHRGCVLLTDDGWCGVQRRGGEPALPRGCSAFPRTPRAWPDAVEVTATFACPEVARLALADDGALGWRAADADAVPRRRAVVDDRPDGEQRAARRVQALAAEVVADARWPLRTRLVQLVAAIVPLGGEPPTSFAEVDARLRTLPDGWRDGVAAWGPALAVPVPTALAWVDGALRARLRHPELDGLGELGRRLGPLGAHAARVEARLRDHGAALDPLFARHLRYLVVEHPPVGDPVAWLQALLLHAAGVRACVLAVPEAEGGWGEVVVDVAWRFARDVEHAGRPDAGASAWTDPATLRTVGALAVLAAV